MSILQSRVGSKLHESPTILILGSEGDGVRPSLLRYADELVKIEGQRGEEGVVDSLNVSVAAALLMQQFLCDAS